MRMQFLPLVYRSSLALIVSICFLHEANAQIGGGGGGGVGGGSGGAFGGGMGGSSLGSSSLGSSSPGGSSNPASLSTFQNGFTGFSTFAVGTGNKNTFGQSSPTRAGRGSTGINTSNPFQQYYLNPLQHGYSNVSSATFGEPLYNATILGTTSTGSTGGSGRQNGTTGRAGTNTRGGASGGANSGAAATFVPSTTPAIPRGLPYITGLASDLVPTQSPIPGAAQRNEMRTQLKSYLVAAKNRLPNADKIDIGFDNEQVVLRGEVNSEREKRLAANMMLLTPGVRGLRNEIQVKGNIPPE